MSDSDDGIQLSPRAVFVGGFLLELGLILPAALIGWWVFSTPFPFEFRLSWDGLAWGAAATVPMVLLAFALTSKTAQRLGPLRRLLERVRSILGHAIAALSAGDVILLSCAAGVGEEVLFRGVIQRATGEHGLITASVIFGLFHALTPTYFALATLLGLYLGGTFILSGNLLAPILVHAIYDAVALLLLRRELRREEGPNEGDDARVAGTGAP